MDSSRGSTMEPSSLVAVVPGALVAVVACALAFRVSLVFLLVDTFPAC